MFYHVAMDMHSFDDLYQVLIDSKEKRAWNSIQITKFKPAVERYFV